jgi:hypothetical protein
MNTIKLPITTALVLGALSAASAARTPARAATVFDQTTPLPAAHPLFGIGPQRLRSGWRRRWKARAI